ncbi:MAG: hypothetical protein ACKKL5_00405 [Candidatus Komeilibacteria bacterium]
MLSLAETALTDNNDYNTVLSPSTANSIDNPYYYNTQANISNGYLGINDLIPTPTEEKQTDGQEQVMDKRTVALNGTDK